MRSPSNQLTETGSSQSRSRHKTHMDLTLGRFPHRISLFALMNNPDAGGGHSDADSSAVLFPPGKAHVAVKSALMPAVL